VSEVGDARTEVMSQPKVMCSPGAILYKGDVVAAAPCCWLGWVMVIPPTAAVAGMETRLKLDLGEDMVVVDATVLGEDDNKEDNGNENIGVVVTDASDASGSVSESEMVAEMADILKLEANKRG